MGYYGCTLVGSYTMSEFLKMDMKKFEENLYDDED